MELDFRPAECVTVLPHPAAPVANTTNHTISIHTSFCKIRYHSVDNATFAAASLLLPPQKVAIPGDKSSQYFSALLLSAGLAEGPVEIEVIGELVSRSASQSSCHFFAGISACLITEPLQNKF
eukprot:SAG31_NODE_21586_length_546_cov_0.572707_1_plen_122_part_01